MMKASCFPTKSPTMLGFFFLGIIATSLTTREPNISGSKFILDSPSESLFRVMSKPGRKSCVSFYYPARTLKKNEQISTMSRKQDLKRIHGIFVALRGTAQIFSKCTLCKSDELYNLKTASCPPLKMICIYNSASALFTVKRLGNSS